MKNIKQWKPNTITLVPNEVFTYNTRSEQTNIFQIINRKASGGGTVHVDTESNVSPTSYQLRVDQGSSQNLILPYEAKVIYLISDAPVTLSIIEISSDDISFVFGAAQLVNISGSVQVQEPITIDGTVSISGETEIKNDSGNPVPVNGTVEVTNDIGNPLPVIVTERNGAVTDRSGTITLGGTAQQAAAANGSRRFLLIQNNSANDLWFNLGVVAVTSQPSIKLIAGEKICFSDWCPTGLVSIIGGTTSQAFTIKEG